MTDTPAHDVTDEDRRIARDWAEFVESSPDTWTGSIRVAALVILNDIPAPAPPTLADMAPEERRACQRLQADTKRGRAIIIGPEWANGHAELIDRQGNVFYGAHADVTPRPDLPPFVWPGDTPAPAPLAPEDYPPRDQLALGAKWYDIAKLEEALRQRGEAADQAIVLDDEGDVHVWETAGGGGWMARIPVQQCGPFRVIFNEKEADQ